MILHDSDDKECGDGEKDWFVREDSKRNCHCGREEQKADASLSVGDIKQSRVVTDEIIDYHFFGRDPFPIRYGLVHSGG